jgi:outer membrane protein OmpA-like peptidoglycan-associated protein
MLSLIRVISGGQTGADQAGLSAAKACGIHTGGTAPLGWLTLKGAKKKLLKSYGLKECKTQGYKARTWANVQNSDGTIRFAKNFNSPGERCTLNALNRIRKPYFDVDLNKLTTPEKTYIEIDRVTKWLQKNHIQILNVAGNAETLKTGTAVFDQVEAFLIDLFMNL